MNQRAIKFRAFDVKNKKMIEYGLFNFFRQPANLLKPELTAESICPFVGIESGEMIVGDELNAWHLMQFTGLLDKNGKEIYEGDILTDGINLCKVIWGDYGWLLEFDSETIDPDHPERWATIVGNIHEHPELLK